jgi:hypothetical protein
MKMGDLKDIGEGFLNSIKTVFFIMVGIIAALVAVLIWRW